MIRTMLAGLASATLMVAPAVAAPATSESRSSASVFVFADLDLARVDHQALLAARVERAAQDACERPFIRDIKSMAAYDLCVTGALDAAQRELVGRQELAAVVLAAR